MFAYIVKMLRSFYSKLYKFERETPDIEELQVRIVSFFVTDYVLRFHRQKLLF